MKKSLFVISLIGMAAYIAGSCSRTDASTATDGESAVTMQPRADTTIDPATRAVAAGLPTVLEFSATWCPPCRRQSPIFHAVEKKYKGAVTMISIDVDQYPDLAEKYDIEVIPTFIFLDSKGEKVGESGFMEETQLEDAVKALLKK